MSLTSCPAADELLAFNLGKLPEECLETVAAHLAECSGCQTTLQTLEIHTDSLVAGLRQDAQEEAYAEETAFREALVKVEALTTECLTEPAGQPPTGAEAAGDSRPELGRLREYQLLEKLGQGSMGTVYKALHTRLKRVVALKLLPPERMNDRATVARFQREMEAVGRLNHPHLVRATDAGEVDGTHFLVMEIIEGQTLAQLVHARGFLPVVEACELVRQAALGLQHVHEHGLVHRDIKPSNLLLSAEGQVKVLDLGLALLKEERPGAEELTATDQMMGTFDYMAPEQFADTHSVDIRADVYSLGCTLYFLLTGKAPFSGLTYANRLSKMMAHAQAPVPPIRDRGRDVPAGLEAVLARMLAKRPGDRFATPAEVAAALAPITVGCDPAELRAMAQVPSAASAREPNVLSGTDEYRSSAMTATTPSAPSAPAIGPGGHRRRLAVTAAAAALVGVGVLLGILFASRWAPTRGSGDREPVPPAEAPPEIKNVREVAKLRSAELLQRSQNTHAILREVMNNKVAGRALENKINDLNNNLTALWIKLAGYGLGRDPYLDHIQLDNSGFSQPQPPPDFGIPGPYVGIGLPRLHERFLEASGAKGEAAEKRSSDFKKLVQAYSNPAVYPHRAFSERAYSEYREGKGVFTPQYVADLQTLDQWMAELETVLGKVPGYFETAP
jgi:serine/threonine protein kinase